MKTMETTEEVSSPRVEKRVKRRHWQQIEPCAREKPRVDWKKDLQVCGEGRESRKRSTLVVDKKPYGKCQITSSKHRSNENMKMSNHMISRRRFLRRSVTAISAAVVAPMIISASTLGRGGAIAPSERITMGFIGVGGQGTGHLLGGAW